MARISPFRIPSYGMLGKHHSEETRQRISKAKIGNRCLPIGYKHSKETLLKMSLGHIGIRPSEETKQKMRLAQRNRKPISELTRLRLSAAGVRQALERGNVSKLEEKAAQQLIDLGVKFVRQYPITNRYVFDFYLPDSNTLLEVNGSYWHADPRLYHPDKLTYTQKRNVARDIKKANLAKRCGYTLRVVWEMDFEKN